MGQRTDTRERIIRSSLRSIREKGYASTSISDIVTASGAPRGSVTFHFRGGKDEIAKEVVGLRLTEMLAELDASSATYAVDFLTECIDRVADEFIASGYIEGCPVVPIAIDRSAESPELRVTSAEFFRAWRGAVSGHLAARGLEKAHAERVATLAVCAIEGALVISRTEQDVDTFAVIRDELRALLS
jgi:TetR/AcrR family transcriptional regulator, lmrAB and yxaGH operons repressor